MMKKVWLVLLAVVLVFGLALVGCGSKSSGSTDPDVPDGKIENPIVDGAKFLRISGRSENWHTLDIKAGKTTGNSLVAGKKHTIKVYGNAPAGTASIQYTNTDSPYASFTGSVTTAGADGMFTIDYEFTVADLTNSAQNIRISVPAKVTSYDIYEVTIEAEGTPVYKMSEDPEIQALESGETNLFKDPSVGGGSTWFWKAGTPKIIVMVPGEEGGGGEEPDPNIAFDAAVGIKVLTKASDADIEIDTATGIISRDINTGYGSWFSVAIPDSPTIIASDTIVIKYIGVGNAPLTPKKSDSTNDLALGNDLKYRTLVGDGTEQTYTIPAVAYEATMPTVITFQGRPNEAAWKLKIISITITHGDPIKIDLPVADLKPVSGGTPITNVTETLQFTGGTISWSPTAATTFAAGTAYTATFSLTAKTGYTFDGIAANGFVVTGADSVTHAVGTTTLSITAVFPATKAPAPDKTITFTDGDVIGIGATVVVETDGSGFTATNTGSYQGAYVYFQVTFAADYKLSDYSKIDITTKPLDATAQYKPIRFAAYATAPATGSSLNSDNANKIAEVSSGNPLAGPNEVKNVTNIAIGALPAGTDLQTVYIGICVHADAGGSYTLSNIKFHN